ncbi:hypothetical protein FDECE_16739 [Fusarium decemcellulare]|nr:hypothetical protein FDECE_16739 [Fusarium decemcellulare]
MPVAQGQGCLACSRIGVVCSGYGARFIWVGHDASQPYRSDGRRMLPSESTWAKFDVLPSDVVDSLLSQCDEDQTPGHSLASQTHSSWTPNFHNPFSVFSLENIDPAPASDDSTVPELLCQLPQNVDSLVSISQEERFLFHHYADHVAGMMLPYEHPRNPWKSHYPAAALQLASSGQKALFRAMLAHSAFNITHLRGNDASMAEIGVRYYTAAIVDLASGLQNKDADFPAMLASIMSLLMAEAYRGQGPDWKHHLRGAQSLLPMLHQTEAGTFSELGCLSLQSFSIIEVVAETSTWNGQLDVAEGRPSNLARTTPEFCFTIGAPRSILECMAKITQFSCQADEGSPSTAKDELMLEVLSCLNTAKNNIFIAEDDPPEAKHQTKAFISATYIYCYRTLLDAPPHAVQHHVQDTFAHVSAFLASSTGNFSLWPAFIAAAEAYTAQDLNAAQEWLSWATSVGIGGRASLRLVLHEVWRQRDSMSKEYGVDAGKIAVDWRQVMHELGCDILLI